MVKTLASLLMLALSFLVLVERNTTLAQPYPVKPVKVVLPFPAGSTADTSARLIGSKLSERLGQPVVIENHVGAGGLIGATMVARASADGYTLLFTTPSTHVIAVFLSKNLPYDPIRDFTPITAAMDSFQGLAVGKDVPVISLRELIEYAKRYPGKLTYGSSGIGTEFHMAGELFKRAAGIDILHVPYKSAVQALPDMVAGQISMMFSTVSSQLAFMRSGKLRIVAILNSNRYPGLPDVPTVAEIAPAFDKPPAWQGFFGPAGLPRPILLRLNADIKASLASAEVRRALDENGQRAIANSPEEFAAMIRAGQEATGKVIRAAGIEPE